MCVTRHRTKLFCCRWMLKWKWLKPFLYDETEIELCVNVTGYFWPGERGTDIDPQVRGYVEFSEALLNNKPFQLTEEEIEKAELAMLDEIINESSIEFRMKWVI